MLVSPGDLIPVTSDATQIPWTRRKSQILNYLRRGAIDFSTLVYDTKVGDISPVSSYYNPERISIKELNTKFAKTSDTTEPMDSIRIGGESVALPWILIYPDHNLDKAKVREERTLRWVMTNDETVDPVTCHRPASKVPNATSSPTNANANLLDDDLDYENGFLPAAPEDSDSFGALPAMEAVASAQASTAGNKRKSSWSSNRAVERKVGRTETDEKCVAKLLPPTHHLSLSGSRVAKPCRVRAANTATHASGVRQI
uniref:Uncharacterized protein n=1 Tax=Pseudodiaptomus poplesia TaxID=213370 RepID=A0A1S6GL97_9MAXI|nr:hypothetical protein [Pseudodiaptomus poplesia]